MHFAANDDEFVNKVLMNDGSLIVQSAAEFFMMSSRA